MPISNPYENKTNESLIKSMVLKAKSNNSYNNMNSLLFTACRAMFVFGEIFTLTSFLFYFSFVFVFHLKKCLHYWNIVDEEMEKRKENKKKRLLKY